MTSKTIAIAVAIATLAAALPAQAKKANRIDCRNPDANMFFLERSCTETIPRVAVKPTIDPQPPRHKQDWRNAIFDNAMNSGGGSDGAGGSGGGGGSAGGPN